MPRRRQRFARLEAALKMYGSSTPAPDSEVGNYLRFKRGEVRMTIGNPVPSSERRRYVHGVVPFNKSVEVLGAASSAAGEPRLWAASITLYSERLRREVLGTPGTSLGYREINADSIRDDNFYPALLRFFVRNSNNPADVRTPTSQITRKPYKRYLGKSASVPFGRFGADTTTLNASEEDARKLFLMNEIKSAQGFAGRIPSVSYEPEVFKVGAPDPAVVPSQLPPAP